MADARCQAGSCQLSCWQLPAARLAAASMHRRFRVPEIKTTVLFAFKHLFKGFSWRLDYFPYLHAKIGEIWPDWLEEADFKHFGSKGSDMARMRASKFILIILAAWEQIRPGWTVGGSF